MNLQTIEMEKPIIPTQRINIETLLEQRIPPSPGGLMRLSELLKDYNASKRQIVQAISYEPVLVARILRLANSSIYSLEREVVKIETAITSIGNQAVSDIVALEIGLKTFNSNKKQSEAEKMVWEHSIAVAMISKEISQTLGMRGLEEAFICGLLHDFGKFLLLSHDQAGYSKIMEIEDEFEMLKAENEAYGYRHTEVGSLVARRWKLHDQVCHSILYHHNPTQAEHPSFVEHIIDVADLLANLKGYGIRQEESCKLEVSESAMKLRIDKEFLDKIWGNAQGKIAEVISTFK
jgi:putative nucleotidyltransferase with HDIG domain